MLTAEVDPHLDYDELAPLASEAFGSGAAFTPERLRWLYEEAFGLGAVSVALRHDGRKVGHVAILLQPVAAGGRTELAGQLVDLFILQPFRSKAAIETLYGEVARQAVARGIRFILGVPNGKAVSVNRRFLSLEVVLTLPIRAGVCFPLRSSRVTSLRFEPADADRLRPLLNRYATAPGEGGPPWTGERLFGRLSDDTRAYGVHATDGLLLVSSPRTVRGLDCTLLCGFLPGRDAAPSRGDQRALIRSACRMWRRPIHLYVGRNRAFPVQPGYALPVRPRGSPMVLQARDFAPDRPALDLDRFELLDFDLA